MHEKEIKNVMETIADKLFSDFKSNLETFKTDIVRIISTQFEGVQQKINMKLDEHTQKLDVHDKILENHLVSITEIKKQMLEQPTQEDKKFSNKLKIVIIGGCIYAITNLTILIYLIVK